MTREDWEELLDGEANLDWDLRLVYADWLEEAGLAKEAAAQRFMAGRRVSPHFGPADEEEVGKLVPQELTVWGTEANSYVRDPGWAWRRACLPREVYVRLKKGRKMGDCEVWKYYDGGGGRRGAEEDLAGALRP